MFKNKTQKWVDNGTIFVKKLFNENTYIEFIQRYNIKE